VNCKYPKLIVRRAVLVAVLIFSTATAMRAQSATSPPAQVQSATREVTDDLDRKIRIPMNPSRIISLAPSITETLYALNLQDRLVGDTDFCDYPAAAKDKPKVGGPKNPSFEQIVALRPDLVLVTKSLNNLETVNALQTLGIPSYAQNATTVEEIMASTQKLADMLGAGETGKALGQEIRERLDVLRARLGDVVPTRVLFVVWTEPLMSVGQKTFIADVLRKAGAVSIVDSEQDWPRVSLEEVARIQPEYLVTSETPHTGSGSHGLDDLMNLPGWRLLEAVKNRKFALVNDVVTRPSPGIILAIEELARQLHPNLFQEKMEPAKENLPKSSKLGRATELDGVLGLQSPEKLEITCAR
jgi:iron complex transport system substrate-binding protein